MRNIALVTCATDNKTTDIKETFEQLAKRLADVKRGTKDGAGWIPSTMTTPRRKNENAQEVNYLVLDLEAHAEYVLDEKGKRTKDEFGDDIKRVIGVDPIPLSDMVARIEIGLGWRAVLHSSYSNTAEHPRYRIVLDTTRPMLPRELKPVGLWVVDQLDIADCYDKGALGAAAQFYYLPRCPSDERLALFECVTTEGDPLDVDSILEQINALPLATQDTSNLVSQSDHIPTQQPANQPQNSADSTPRGSINEMAAIMGALPNTAAVDYDQWLKVVAACHYITRGDMVGYATAFAWSAKNPAHDKDKFDKTWRSFDPNHPQPITMGTLKDMAGKIETLAMFGDAESSYIHPLTKIIDLSNKPAAPKWILPRFIAEGLVMIAGGHGVGKTTALLPLAMAVAGVHDKDYRLAPKHWRHVVYITEDVNQAQRIMTGYGEHLDWNNKDIFQNMRERVHVVEACRMSAQMVARAGEFYRERFSRTVTTTGMDGNEYTTELLPLIVIDTMAATIELENENDNSEASQAVAALKQQFEGLPTWIVGHVAKANLGRSDAVTLRGAGAFEADANQVLYLVQDEQSGARWLTRGKTRFESPWQELEIKSDHRIITVTNQFGDAEELVLRWSIASPPDDSRAERAEKAKTERDQLEAEELKRVILTNVAQRYAAGSPLNKTALRDITGRGAATTSNAIATLIADAWLHEIEVPAKERLKNKHSFLIALDDQERAEFLELGVIPEAKQWIPESWKKQADTI